MSNFKAFATSVGGNVRELCIFFAGTGCGSALTECYKELKERDKISFEHIQTLKKRPEYLDFENKLNRAEEWIKKDPDLTEFTKIQIQYRLDKKPSNAELAQIRKDRAEMKQFFEDAEQLAQSATFFGLKIPFYYIKRSELHKLIVKPKIIRFMAAVQYFDKVNCNCTHLNYPKTSTKCSWDAALSYTGKSNRPDVFKWINDAYDLEDANSNVYVDDGTPPDVHSVSKTIWKRIFQLDMF